MGLHLNIGKLLNMAKVVEAASAHGLPHLSKADVERIALKAVEEAARQLGESGHLDLGKLAGAAVSAATDTGA